MLSEADLDTSYTELCHTMTSLGEAQAQLFLARFALLALSRLDKATQAQALIDAAAQGLGVVETAPQLR
jgi:hypothetical protein